ncbi:MAG: hypothetical protein IPP04_02990 [Saprospiraceae bacterium]|nr:hypothetical protein [Saprospiraceae bacterium]
MYSRHSLEDTIVALATAPGLAAIAVIRISGDQAFEIVEECFEGRSIQDLTAIQSTWDISGAQKSR